MEEGEHEDTTELVEDDVKSDVKIEEQEMPESRGLSESEENIPSNLGQPPPLQTVPSS